jgi:membrane associated rhomboid family serine protease
MFPYRDDNPTLSTPIVTLLLIGASVAVWLLVQGMGQDPQLSRSVCELGLIPGEYLGHVVPGTTIPLSPGSECVLGVARHWYTPVTSMFLHGGWFHLIGNMWYLLCGLAAAATQTFMSPDSITPMVGASGAISGVMGAYIVLYPRVRVHMLIFLFIFITRIVVPAYLMLGYWFLLQLLGGSAARGEGGVAFWAHVGGFVAGALLISVFKDQELVRRHRAMAQYV